MKDPNIRMIQGTEIKNMANNESSRIQKVESEMLNKKRLNYLEDFRKYIMHLITK